MITNPEDIRRQYEPTRLSRYSHIKKRETYTAEDLCLVYEIWRNHPYSRERLWDDYCDIRDRMPRGTNNAIRKVRAAKPWVN